MNTQDIMNIALQLAGLSEVPSDSGIIVPCDNVKRVFAGVDMETAELLMAKDLGVDLVLGHHPKTGRPSIDSWKCMDFVTERLIQYGVPRPRAQKLYAQAKVNRAREAQSKNYDRVQSAAKLLNMPYMNIHTPADLIVQDFVQKFLDERFADKPKTTLQDVIDAMMTIPEYQLGLAQPIVRVGEPTDYAGKIVVHMAGGIGNSPEAFLNYFENGIGTLIVMHCAEETLHKVQEQNIGNIIVAGHMASDSIGMNFILGQLEKAGVEVLRTSGIMEVHRG